MLFDDRVSTEEVLYYLVRWKDDHERWIGKHLEGGGYGLS